MGLFLLKRLLTLMATLLGASAVVFLVLEILPGNAAQMLMGPDASPEAVAALQALLARLPEGDARSEAIVRQLAQAQSARRGERDLGHGEKGAGCNQQRDEKQALCEIHEDTATRGRAAGQFTGADAESGV